MMTITMTMMTMKTAMTNMMMMMTASKDQDADDQITPMDAAAPIRLTARLLRRASVAKRAMSWKWVGIGIGIGIVLKSHVL